MTGRKEQKRKGNRMKGYYSQTEFVREYNAVCGKIFREERISRGVSMEGAARGLRATPANLPNNGG